MDSVHIFETSCHARTVNTDEVKLNCGEDQGKETGNTLTKAMKKGFRPTKAASKRRRDLLNVEIARIRNLLPLSELQRQRLSQLQVMSLCSAYVGLNNFLGQLCFNDNGCEEILQNFNLMQMFPGFLLIVASDGQVLYASDNVIDLLGYSSVELLTNGDNIYDFIEASDHSNVKSILESMKSSSTSENDLHTLSCQMFLAQNFRSLYGYHHYRTMDIKGRILRKPAPQRSNVLPEAIFVALVSPHSKPFLDPLDSPSFQSVHSLDLRFVHLDHDGSILLGYSKELISKSWYELIHPDDIQHMKEQHMNLLRNQGMRARSACVRLQTRYGHFIWLQIAMLLRKSTERMDIVCNNYIVTEEIATEIRRSEELTKTEECGIHSEMSGCGSIHDENFWGEKQARGLDQHHLAGFGFQQQNFPEFYGGERTSMEGLSTSFCQLLGTNERQLLRSAKSSLQFPYPLLKEILNRPTVRDVHLAELSTHGDRTPEPSRHSSISAFDALLTPQNSPSHTVLQEFQNTSELLQTSTTNLEHIPSSAKQHEINCASHSIWEQPYAFRKYCETPQSVRSEELFDLEPSFLESQPPCFEEDVESLPMDVVVAALRAMQNDPQLSKEVEGLELGMFSESFPEMEMKSQFSTKTSEDSPTTSLAEILLPFLNSSVKKLTTSQVENLNQRLSELKKIHETMVVEALVETLNSGGNKKAVCWNDLIDIGDQQIL